MVRAPGASPLPPDPSPVRKRGDFRFGSPLPRGRGARGEGKIVNGRASPWSLAVRGRGEASVSRRALILIFGPVFRFDLAQLRLLFVEASL